jgi:hypothetical protein
MTTTLLIDFARDQNPGRRIVLWAVTPEGTVAMSAEVELA